MAAATAAKGLRELLETFGAKGLQELTSTFSKETFKELVTTFGAKGLKAAQEAVGKSVFADIAKEFGAKALKDTWEVIGEKGMKELASKLSAKEIKQFVTELGAKPLKELLDKFNADVLKHYGVEFFKQHKGVTKDTMQHLLTNDGIVKGEIKGCHDKNLFLSELKGKGEVVATKPSPTNPDVTKYDYKLYQKDKTNKIIDPPTLSTGKPKEKTVINDLASNPDKWQKLGNEAVDEAIKKKALPKTGGEFSEKGIRGYYRDGQVKSFFPEF